MKTAKLFKNGESQAVRLPKEFRFPGNEGFIKRVGSAVVLLPKARSWETETGRDYAYLYSIYTLEILTFTSINGLIWPSLDVFINMKTLRELGTAVALRRKALGLKQHTVALKAGLSPESLSRFERGHSAEFGSRKLLSVLAVLGMELQFTEMGTSGSLDELRRERAKS